MILKGKFYRYLLLLMVIILSNCNISEKKPSQSKDTLIINDTLIKDSIIKKDTVLHIKKDSLPSKKKTYEGIGGLKGGSPENGTGSSSNPRNSSEPGREITAQQRKEEYFRQIEERRKGITERKDSKSKDDDSVSLKDFKK